MPEVSSILLIGSFVVAAASVIGLVKFWMDMGSTRSDAEAARKSASEAHRRIDEIAKSAATNDDILAVERRMAEAVDGLRGDFRHMAGRLDQVLVTLASKA